MTGIQFLLILFLLPGLPLFQMDQAADNTWSVCEYSLFVRLEIEGPLADQNLSLYLDPPSCTLWNLFGDKSGVAGFVFFHF